MADSSTLSFRVQDQIIDALDRAATKTGISRSALAREAFLQGLDRMAVGEVEGAETEIEVPDHLAHEAKIRELIARNRAERRRGKFRSEFSKQLRSSFENNESPAEFRKSVAGYIEEAEDLGELGEEIAREVPAAVETYAEWCEHMLDYYEAAYRGQNFDHDPIDDPLGNHAGIEHMREWMDRAESIADALTLPDRDRETARNIARHSMQDDLVPERVQEHANDLDDPTEAVFDAALEIAGPDDPQIEGDTGTEGVSK